MIIEASAAGGGWVACSDDGILRGEIQGSIDPDRACVEFRIGTRLIGSARLRSADTPDGPLCFQCRPAVDARSAVSAWLMPQGVELRGSPLVMAPVMALSAEPPSPGWDAEYVEVKRFAPAPGAEVALFVTHSATGALKPHVALHLKALQTHGVAALLIVVADHPVSLHADILATVAGAIVRGNRGYDFGAWAHAMRIYPQVYDASSVYLINDSMLGPPRGAAFAQMIARIRQSDADLIGLTDNLEYHWHLQSYFMVLRPRLLLSDVLRDFFDGIMVLQDKDAVIEAYELRFSPSIQDAGFKVEAMFAGAAAGNSTLKAWRTLLKQGFPFVKVLLVAGWYPHIDTQGWRETLDAAGFDLDVVESTLRMREEEAPLEQAGRLVAHPRPAPVADIGQARLGYVGPHHLGGPRGDAARKLIAGLRPLGAGLSLHPTGASVGDGGAVAPAVVVRDFGGPSDLMLVDVSAVLSAPRDEVREEALSSACLRVGLIDGVESPSVRARIVQGEAFAELWTSSPALVQEALRLGGTPVVLVPELDPLFDPTAPRATGVVPCGMDRRIADLLRRAPDRRPARRIFDFGLYTPSEVADFGQFIGVLQLCADGAPPASARPIDADWICLAPEGTLLNPSLSNSLVLHARRLPHVAVFYGDDVAVESEFPVDQLRLKPDFDLTLLESQDYVGAPVLVRRDAYAALGGMRTELGTAAVADLLFRSHAMGLGVRRIPEVLLAHPGVRVRAREDDYHRMLQAQPHLAEREITVGRASGTFSSRLRPTSATAPAVTLILPPLDTPEREDSREDLLEAIGAEGWPSDRLKVVCAHSASRSRAGLADDRHPFIIRRIDTTAGDGHPDSASVLNALWRAADTDLLVVLDDDVQPRAPGWLGPLLTYAADPTVGIVAGRLIYPDGRLMSAGQGPSTVGPMDLWQGRREAEGSYQDWSLVAREWSMAGAAVTAMRRSLLSQVGGFDPNLSRARAGRISVCACVRWATESYTSPLRSLLGANRQARAAIRLKAPLGSGIAGDRGWTRIRPGIQACSATERNSSPCRTSPFEDGLG